MNLVNRRYPAICRVSFFFLSVALAILLLFSNGAVSSETRALQKKAEMAWVKENVTRFDIGYCFYDGQNWSDGIILTTGNPVNFTPSIAKKKNGNTWLIWSSDTGEQYHLYHTIISSDNSVEGPFLIETGMTSNATPVIIIDSADTAWIVWSGNNGADDDIYYSSHDGFRWAQPKRLHQKNEVPDVFPQLNVEKTGTVRVDWTTVDSSGITKSSKYLLNNQKEVDTLQEQQIVVKDLRNKISNCVSSLPAFIDNLDLATIQLNCVGNAGTVQFIGKALGK